MRWDSEPGLGDYATDVTQDGPVVYDLPQKALASECADRDEVRARCPVVEALQASQTAHGSCLQFCPPDRLSRARHR